MFRRKKEPVLEQCFGLLKTGTQTIPCPRTLPCVHHEDGKGTYDLRSQISERDLEELDEDHLTLDEKLNGIMGFLEEINERVGHITEALGLVSIDELPGTIEEEETHGEGEVDEEADSEVEPTPQQSEELSLDDIPGEDELK